MLLKAILESKKRNSPAVIRMNWQSNFQSPNSGGPSGTKLDAAMMDLIVRLADCYGEFPEFSRGQGYFWQFKFTPEAGRSPVYLDFPSIHSPEVDGYYQLRIRRDYGEFRYSPHNDAELAQIIPVDRAEFIARWKNDERAFARSLPKSICRDFGYAESPCASR